MTTLIANKKFVKIDDYRPLDWVCKNIFLNLKVFEKYTKVESKLYLFKNEQFNKKSRYLLLYGKELKTTKLNVKYIFDNSVKSFLFQPEKEIIYLKTPIKCKKIIVKSIVKIFPKKNTSLEGLYQSKKIFTTQCEPQGFRKITWFPDRPDNLSIFKVRIETDKSYKNLLSNGNLIKKSYSKKLNRKSVIWSDPFPKPSYLFAIVIGNLDLLKDKYLTKSNKLISLEIYTELGNKNNAHFAMSSLKKAFEWEEKKYGLIYDLDNFMIVAVDHFNMGAMENKGLNIFNSKFILSDTNISTDTDYLNIESIIAHEYFHNWTGNRVTCRDWFQLTLKEGLTVFRDQQFTSDIRNPIEKRIKDVILLRSNQFIEDAGPNRHSIRPEKYLEINNFYTATIYEKGAEVIRMISNYIGEKKFIKSVSFFLKKFDGMAVTCEDFLNSIQFYSKIKINEFLKWYKQKGTINLYVKRKYIKECNKLEIEFIQNNRFSRLDVPIPIRFSFFDSNGKKKKFSFGRENEKIEHTYLLQEKRKKIYINDLDKNYIPSLLRNFSAPVNLKTDLNFNELIYLLKFDDDLFNKWDISQSLFMKNKNDHELILFEKAIKYLIKKNQLSDEVLALILTPPTYKNFQNYFKNFDPLDLYLKRKKNLKIFFKRLEKDLLFLLNKILNFDYESVKVYNKRSLLKIVLDALCMINNKRGFEIAVKLCESKIMSLKLLGINSCIKYDHPQSKKLLKNFNKDSNNNITL